MFIVRPQPTGGIHHSLLTVKGRKYLSPFIALVWLPFLILTLSSHTKTLAWVSHWKLKET